MLHECVGIVIMAPKVLRPLTWQYLLWNTFVWQEAILKAFKPLSLQPSADRLLGQMHCHELSG